MRDVGFETVIVLVILLPGFLCARIVQALCVRREQTELDKVVEALLYSFLIYLICAALRVAVPVTLVVQAVGDVTKYSIEPHTRSLVWFAVVAVALALLLAASETNDSIGRVLRWLRVTQRTGRASLWSDVFHTFSGYVQVELQDGRSLLGWVRLYSDMWDEPGVFLEDACWVDSTNNTIPIVGPGILVTKDSGIRSIAFLQSDRGASEPT